MSRKLPFWILLTVAGVLTLISILDQPRAPTLPLEVSQFLSERAEDRHVRVRGALVPGTLCKVAADCGYRFRLSDRNEHGGAVHAQLRVSFAGCMLPDPFRDWPGYTVDLVVEGNRCQSCHDFEASSIWARGGGEYEIGLGGSSDLPPWSETPRCVNAM